MGGNPQDEVSALMAFPVLAPEPAGLEIRVNFGVFAGREATASEIEKLAAALMAETGPVEIVSERRYEFASDREAEIHLVRIPVPPQELPGDEFRIGELAGRLVAVSERWLRTCIAERHAELSEL